MSKPLSRRDFLSVSGLGLAALLGGSLVRQGSTATARPPGADPTTPNLIILLFDALSARHISLYGYPRQTTPHLEAFAGQCLVYHAHHAAANFTTPSTASLLTGTYPWSHRAYHSIPRPQAAAQNIFQAVGADTLRLGFAQNLLADMILEQLDAALDRHVRVDQFSLTSSPLYAAASRAFANDSLASTLATQDFLYSTRNRPGSLFFSLADRLSTQALHAYFQRKYRAAYPYGLPYSYLNNMLFDQRPVFDGAAGLLRELPAPFLAYLHFWSPHEPYRPHQDFAGLFHADAWHPVEKPAHPLDPQGLSADELDRLRRRYDEGIAHIDAEFGRLVESLRAGGLLDNSAVIVTSDHGQLFERGVEGHTTPLLYEPLLHIPLLIHLPGQQQRQDFRENTSAIDLLPSLLHLSRRPIPGWAQGQLLPGLGGDTPAGRTIFAIEAKETAQNQPLEHYTIAVYKGQHKLIAYQYPDFAVPDELYNLADDPEELHDLSAAQPALAQALKAELLTALKRANHQL